ncbi:MazG nucleotide pyrophosphohydrolase domain-containing protein [Sediminivirga luteola]|uniref:MazG nucleotide pyrophosphohydrolase domain-containing protein n=1 Tax=Sediminivirga luteola TaxID=1774748 RepID=UPI001F57E801|nr:MazG nucleotide pyrophosphohydrolase domain-containing protein [Sediminivirga luteola]MCI2266708.1 hypothetical protein [Sediminivirga luteola]
MSESTDRLLEMMRRLRAPDGCAWSRRHTHESLVPFAIEEAYEVAEAVDAGNPDELADELGDLLFQVLFHAQVAAERGTFDFDEVARRLAVKLAARTPHVFGPDAAPPGEDIEAAKEQAERSWEEQKKREKPERRSALDGIPERLPELARTQKLLRRAHRAGLDPRTGAPAHPAEGAAADAVTGGSDVRGTAGTGGAGSPSVAGTAAAVPGGAGNLPGTGTSSDAMTGEPSVTGTATAGSAEDERAAAEARIGALLWEAVSLAEASGLDAESALRRHNRAQEAQLRAQEDAARG